MKTLISLFTLAAAFSAPAYAVAHNTAPTDMPADSRIKLLMYSENDVYTITMKYGYETNIEFASGEEIQTISVGDRSLWQITPSGNRLFIRPMEDNVTTNMTVITNRHSYQFDLKSASSAKNTIYVAKFMYPDDQPKHVSAPEYIPVPPVFPPPSAAMMPPPPPAVMPAPPEASEVLPEYPNYHYSYSGPDELAPLQVYDDGKSTFIKYRDAGQPFPNAYIVDAGGAETPATYHVKGDMMVIDNVVGELELKNSDGTVNIYNDTMK